VSTQLSNDADHLDPADDARDHHQPSMPSDERAELDDDLVSVRRNVLLSGVVGGLSLLLGLAYLIRGSSGFDVLLGLLLLAVAVLHLPALAWGRTPVLVADDQGIRLRIGLDWRGMPWTSLREVVVEYADSPLREGRLVLVPRDPKATFNNLGLLAEAHLRWNNLWYDAPLSIPLGITTVVDVRDLAAELAALADGRVEIVNLRGRELSRLDEVPAHPVTDPPEGPEGLVLDEQPVPYEPDEDTGYIGQVPDHTSAPTAHEPFDFSEQVVVHDVVDTAADFASTTEVIGLPAAVLPLRDLNEPARVDVRLDPPSVPEQRVSQEVEDSDASEESEDRGGPGGGAPSWDELPTDIAIDDLHPESASTEPVIGPKIVHAREMLDMSIDELSQRTRIRPHVLEAIEVDDFGPCGGDFYARGHLTAISRALGLTLDPLLKTYDERYAQAPINARRVFEAELSTGLSGGMRATLGGPRWSLLIGSVLCLTMVWGLARIFAGDPEHLTAAPDSSQSAGLAANQKPITSPKMKTTTMTVTAAHAATKVVVRDRTGKILWSGDLRIGKHRTIIGLAPFGVSADNAGAVEVSVKGKALGTIGTAGAPGSKKFR
jgi:cytoskeleton protein RodZ